MKRIIPILILANIIVPFLLGILLVFVFNQAPEFSVIGILMGLLIIQVYFAIKFFAYKLWIKIIIGLIVFGISLILSTIIKDAEFISRILYDLLPGDAISERILRTLIVFSLVAFVLWTVISFFPSRVSEGTRRK